MGGKVVATVVPGPYPGEWQGAPKVLPDHSVTLAVLVPRASYGATEATNVTFFAQWDQSASPTEICRIPRETASHKDDGNVFSCTWPPQAFGVQEGQQISYWYIVADAAGRTKRSDTYVTTWP